MRAWPLIALLALATPAAAQTPPQDYAGPYTLSGLSEGDEVCDLTLGDEPVVGGWSIDIPKDCFDKFGISSDIAAWTTGGDGEVRFIDALRKPLLIFEKTEIGGYVAHPSEGEPISLDRKTDAPELTAQERMSGAFIATRMGGDPLCLLTLTSNKDGMAGTLKPRGACQAPWASAAKWRIEGEVLLLSDAKGKTLVKLRGDPILGFGGTTAGGDDVGLSRDVEA